MTSESTFRLIALVLFVTTVGMSVHFRRRADRSGEDEIGFGDEVKWALWVRSLGALVGYGSMLAYLVYPPLVAWAQVDLSLGLRWAGAGLMALMLPLLYWMFISLGKNVTPTVAIREEHELVTHGPYRHIRHPLYTFGFLAFTGMSLLAANWLMFSGLAVGFAALALRTPLEEQRLLERFGDQYRTYLQRTGRYLPKVLG